jgi:NAD(P)-dependent dehydrogenase (short-subunit alcohol dehydrogenase family)
MKSPFVMEISMSDPQLQNRVVLIVGAGRPPAPALARAFAAAGAVVAINDLSPIPLDPIAAAVQAQGGKIASYVADATRGMPLRAMIDDVVADWGRIDILVNNPRIQPNMPFMEIDEWDWQRTVEMNLNGPFLVTQLVSRLMREQGQGTILNIIDANPEDLEAPGRAAYAASQAGLLALSQAAARELIAYNIRVHTLCPERSTLADGETLASLAIYLCSPAAAAVPGQLFRSGQIPTEGNAQE